MRRKGITISIIMVTFLMMYFNYNLVIGYYDLSIYNIKISSKDKEIKMKIDEPKKTIYVDLQNNTRNILSSDKNIFLSYHVLDSNKNQIIYDNLRANIPIINPFNDVKKIPVDIININKKGNYIVQIDIVEEGVAWFSDKGNDVFEINMNID